MESTPNSERSVEMVDSSARIEDLKYLSASNVNVSNFVSVKLSGESNYGVWKSQMLCLMETRKMRGIVDPKFDGPDATDVETLKQYDSLLKGWIFGSVSEHVLRTVVNLGSAIAVWKKLQLVFDHDDSFPQDSDLLEQFTLTEISTVTQAENIDDIQLRKATVEGRWWRAEAILKNAKMAATEAISNDGNTMLHLAVELGQNDFVKKLLDFIDDGNEIEKQNLDGRTALHIAAIVGNTYAAELLVKKRKELLGISDHKTHVPLLSAYYNMQLNTFIYLLEATEIKHCVHSRLHPGVNLLITAIFTKQYDLASKLAKVYPELATNDDQVLMAMVKTFPSELGFREALIYPSSNKVQREIVKTSSSLFYSYEFSFARAKDILWEIRRFKSTYHSCSHVLSNLSNDSSPRFGAFVPLLCAVFPPMEAFSKHRCYRRPIIEAACHGVYEVVDEILFRSPKAIGFTNRNGHNIIQLAIINRSEKIYNLIRHTIKRAALQLQRELQWRKEVEKLMLPTDLIKENIDMETPEMVFTREHDHLVKEGEKWMKTTAESCSITAALITTIVFAAAITVPGGSNQETGIPLFRKEIAFTIFAVSDAISLFASSTALLVFLSILTTRFSEQDFLVSLPRRLIIGFFVLFLSTSAMMVAFCAVLFLVFCDQRAWMVAPIGVLACLPITAVVTLQFPLVVELFLSTYFSFGKQNYIDRCKSNLNNMQSFFDRLGIEHES
ncbi:uncharacterized protein LOC112501840 [Cynara cardunculus var. scolymus]|uniref:uncharacterized protein LOC112501840 n=1 Tax=Cynara cardunculus var. scolymus TaxID=59895 RepID=UPI000D62D247|nr:uncharacterized protein LOC112501840 [Cynara cardunculus var. scolymus]